MPTRHSILRPLGLALLLAIGAGIVWSVALSIMDRSIQQFGPDVLVNENLMVGTDGKVLIATYVFSPYRKDTYRTLEGKEIRLPWGHTWLDGAFLPGLDNPYASILPLEPFATAQHRVRPVLGLGQPPTLWYFMHDGKPGGRGYFVGYHADSRRLAGYLGANGFRDDVPPPGEQFPTNARQTRGDAIFPGYERLGMQPSVVQGGPEGPEDSILFRSVMLSDDRLLEIDFRTGATRELLNSPGLMSVSYLSRPTPPGDEVRPRDAKPQPLLLAVRTPDTVLVSDRVADKWLSYPIPSEIRDLYSVKLYLLSDNTALFIATQMYPDRSPREEVIRVNAKGVVTERVMQSHTDAAGKVTQLPGVELAGRGAPLSPARRTWMAALTAPSPLAVGVYAAMLQPLGEVKAGFAEDYPSALAQSLSAGWLPLLVVFAVGGGLAWLTCRRQRVYALPWTGVWTTFVFLAGAPGFIAYLWHRRWPVRQACPACGQTVPRDREACSRCGEEFSAPVPKGIEVFAP
jgi:hypothetical protein